MGITKRREADKKVLKQKIFDSASKLIIEHGYEKLSIRKLANEIEYSPAMIYNYFKNKDDIIKAITLDNYDRIFRELLCIDFESMTPKIALKTGLLTLAQLILNHREQFKATLLSGVNTTGEMASDNGAMDLIINILNKGVSLGNFVIDNTKFTAFLLTTGIFGVVNMFVLNNIYDENMINATINAYVEILVKGVTK
ncbi:TetR/AcrR family transcriptional regulator [Clostridium estertheticum]|uniref:TetR/AcrR family transcriptional regulator n=1 Tax=Clostridium estertheticum TaxID=238834 RepID=UPI0013EE6F10|nr:TetR/AcrR family transcriptional regulator [Clostridium estertheticum]MBZ9607265.1 TetR/AcrR family transcriptional regulator [Clostridium estertheticum]